MPPPLKTIGKLGGGGKPPPYNMCFVSKVNNHLSVLPLAAKTQAWDYTPAFEESFNRFFQIVIKQIASTTMVTSQDTGNTINRLSKV